MDEGFRTRGSTEYGDRTATQARPDRIAFWALVLAVVALIAGAASARAGSGGVGDGSRTGVNSKYSSMWDSFSHRDKRWARKTSECESGGNPKAIGGGGAYRGAFQFTRPTWRHAPKSPGGDPIDYPWKTQAVVAVKLKHREGTSPWPNCG